MKRISQHKAKGAYGKAKTFRIDRTLDKDLKRAGEDRYAKGRWPYTDSGILTLALEEWLEREGYVRVEGRVQEVKQPAKGLVRVAVPVAVKEPVIVNAPVARRVMEEEAVEGEIEVPVISWSGLG